MRLGVRCCVAGAARVGLGNCRLPERRTARAAGGPRGDARAAASVHGAYRGQDPRRPAARRDGQSGPDSVGSTLGTGWRLRFSLIPALDTYPRCVTVAQTVRGKASLLAAFAVGLALLGNSGCWVITGFLALTTFLPRQRRVWL